VQSGSATSRKPTPAPAQTSDDDLLKVREKLALEVEYLRRVRALSTEEKAALNEKIAALESLVKVHKEIAESYKAAAGERSIANTADAARIALLEKIVEEYKAERARLMKERDAARRGGRLLAGVALVFGILVGVFATKN
jgi:hypothetical protein